VILPYISVVVPAFNEEKFLGPTLDSLNVAADRVAGGVEIIVVDNASTDGTSALARARGARVVREDRRQIAAARNAGVRAAAGEIVVTCDADNRVSENILERIAAVMGDGKTLGGGVRILPERDEWKTLWIFRTFDWAARWLGLGFGVMFTRRDTFWKVGGFPESVYVGEDGFFAWALRREARRRGMRVVNLRDAWVRTSLRKMDQFGVPMVLWRHLKFLAAPWMVRRREACPTWYAVRGSDPATDRQEDTP
jgi:glycosyltransferase involved in cell wall biosynthesis